MRKILGPIVLLAFLLPPCLQARELYAVSNGDTALSLKTSLKANWEATPVDARTATEQTAADAFWRLRVEPGFKFNSEINLDLAWDMQSLLTTPSSESELLPQAGPGYFRIRPLGWIARQPDLSVQQELDRAWVAYQPEWGNFTLGRQAIGWGRGVLFSAVDIFAPFSPLDPDREWRRGVDALRADVKLSDHISLDLVAAPGSNPNQKDSPVAWNDSILAGRLRGDLGTWDAELVAGRRGADRMSGCTVSLPLGDLELHGEAALFTAPGDIPDSGFLGQDDWVPKLVLGASNHFALGEGLTMAVEYHYSGFGVSDIHTLMDRLVDPGYQNRYARGDTQIPGREACALQATYTISALWQAGFNLLQSATDASGVLAPSVQWNFAESVTLLLNGLWAYGSPEANGKLQSQFGGIAPSWLVQIRIYD